MRRVIRDSLPPGYRETMNWGMIAYGVPLSRYPNTYNGQPLCYAALAAQKNYCAVYLMGVYQDPRQLAALKAAFKKAGKKLDVGKSCVRFRTLEDLPLEAIGDAIAAVPVEKFIPPGSPAPYTVSGPAAVRPSTPTTSAAPDSGARPWRSRRHTGTRRGGSDPAGRREAG